jgi:hypothetical protein
VDHIPTPRNIRLIIHEAEIISVKAELLAKNAEVHANKAETIGETAEIWDTKDGLYIG